MLVHRVQIEHQDQSGQSAHPFFEIQRINFVVDENFVGKRQANNGQGQYQGDHYSERPKGPFSALHLGERREDAGDVGTGTGIVLHK